MRHGNSPMGVPKKEISSTSESNYGLRCVNTQALPLDHAPALSSLMNSIYIYVCGRID
jgi:hypothetical protein